MKDSANELSGITGRMVSMDGSKERHMPNTHPENAIKHDLPDFDATMRRLVRVPKSEVKGA